ncbi:vacuolar protein sorting-associated protein 33B [Aplysia californica]|uniref:Vacuolar protein sorting-associated protein 33B n=1 Tax=Aplysia californica TaxID=6500 RepID=A0ABM0K1C3_APLCA|nr:vacuolar protein sorting-associated protein 33B [Aplysia californica]XP_005106440.1 vacuolar protein sorting-associated protein 33B [Aplysia californica]XP_035827780.1 vacuolar protein sorting-associated protein 33B [Aplysia californica]
MDLQELSKLLKTQLAHLLVSIPESKDLVLDADLTKPLDRVAGISFLKEHGVDKIFKLEAGQKALPGCGQRVYLVHPKMTTMKYIADHIKTERGKGERRAYKIVFVPRRLHICEKILESEGVMGYVTLDEFPLELFPLDTDLLSLETPDFFKSFYLENDTTYLHTVASSLVNLQRLFGKIPNVYTIGKGAKMTYELMQSMFEAHVDRKESKFHVGQLFIVDRDVDLISPMCSAMTYEALLDETFGIECCMINFDSSVTGDNKDTKLLLTSQDEIYSQIRDRHFAHVFSYLSAKAKDLQAIYSKKNNLKTVGDMKEYVANELRVLKHQQKLLATHIGACEVIMKTKNKSDFESFIRTEHSLLEGTDTKENLNYIEECLQKQFSPTLTLRLMCLLSLTQEGLSARDYKNLTTQFLHSHGFEHLVTFLSLKRLGLLTVQEVGGVGNRAGPSLGKKSNYRMLNRRLALVPKQGEETDLKTPTDMSYIFSGAYTPISCKLIEQILTRDTLVGLEEVGRLCGGLFSDIKQKKQPASGRSGAPTDPVMKVALVYFLGGCTYSEISALRFISRQLGVRIIVATTAIVSSQSLLGDIMEKSGR